MGVFEEEQQLNLVRRYLLPLFRVVLVCALLWSRGEQLLGRDARMRQ